MTADVVRVRHGDGIRFQVRCPDHDRPWNADAGWSKEKAEALALQHDTREHPALATLTAAQLQELHDIRQGMGCFCGEHWDDPAGEFVHSARCGRCRLDLILADLAPVRT